MKKLITVLGARPQFVKAGVVSSAIADTDGLEELLVHTGQHYDANMSDVFFQEFGLPAPAHHLGIGSGSHGAQTGRMLIELEQVVMDEAPDGLMVYGDTNSTLAGALVAAKLHIPLIHVEAGLRSFNRAMPEEINRIVTDAVSTLLLAPTQVAADHLAREGVASEKIEVTGDVMYDAVLRASAAAGPPDREAPYYAATIHRAENTDDPEKLGWILDVLSALTADMPVVLPLHPRTRGVLERTGMSHKADKLTLIEPVGYAEMMRLVGGATAVLTDSGGLQKEAFFLGKPVHVFRTETEWVELIDTGWAGLLPPGGDSKAAVTAIRSRGGAPGHECTAYGDGKAALKVVDAIVRHLR
ncbi:MAG: UDP-N-acetylglucosamine 2-epimerase (non-hydrolyzing) [Pseudomonadota bacterium]